MRLIDIIRHCEALSHPRHCEARSAAAISGRIPSHAIAAPAARNDDDVVITGLTTDSRQVKPGFLFAAWKGSVSDGNAFIPDALAKGASVILAETGTVLPVGAEALLITDPNPRRLFAQIAAAFYVKQPETIVAVTGTNGKTSTAYFCQQLWNHLGVDAVSVGTIGICGKNRTFEPGESLTTPDPVTLHKLLSEVEADAVALEASSHGLDQYRLEGVRLKAAAFTNLTRDHLDYHGSFAEYFAAKQRLFSELLPEGGGAVLNADIPEYETLVALCKARHQKIISYGRNGGLRLVSIGHEGYGQAVTVMYEAKEYRVKLGLIGEFQVYNALCAAGLLIAAGMAADKVIPALAVLKPAPGRMELVEARRKAVFVDYAHTPDALEKALTQLRPYAKKRLWVVFGCGGDRDAGKRPEMGGIAARYADKIIVTDDNPRTENPEDIRQEILAACKGAEEIADRKAAISEAIRWMEPGDTLLIAGKGHEKVQKIGKVALPFDDVAVAREALR